MMYFVRFRAALRGKCRKVRTTDDADVIDKGIRIRAHEHAKHANKEES